MHPVVDTRFPNPPGRSERKYRLSSSFDMVGVWSWHRELTGASRCTGSDHSELAKDMAWSFTPTGADCDSHATSSSASGTREATRDAVIMSVSFQGPLGVRVDIHRSWRPYP